MGQRFKTFYLLFFLFLGVKLKTFFQEPSCARTTNRVRIQEPNEMISRVASEPVVNHQLPCSSSSRPLLDKPTILNKGRNGAVATGVDSTDYICPSATEVVHFEPARTDAPHAFGACVLKESCTRRSVGVSTRCVHSKNIW